MGKVLSIGLSPFFIPNSTFPFLATPAFRFTLPQSLLTQVPNSNNKSGVGYRAEVWSQSLLSQVSDSNLVTTFSDGEIRVEIEESRNPFSARSQIPTFACLKFVLSVWKKSQSLLAQVADSNDTAYLWSADNIYDQLASQSLLSQVSDSNRISTTGA